MIFNILYILLKKHWTEEPLRSSERLWIEHFGRDSEVIHKLLYLVSEVIHVLLLTHTYPHWRRLGIRIYSTYEENKKNIFCYVLEEKIKIHRNTMILELKKYSRKSFSIFVQYNFIDAQLLAQWVLNGFAMRKSKDFHSVYKAFPIGLQRFFILCKIVVVMFLSIEFK